MVLLIIGIIIFLYIVISFVVQLSQKKIDFNKPNWTKYRIKSGKSNFWPLEPWWLIFNPKGFEGLITFPEEAYTSFEEWKRDKDWYDKNKLSGLTQFYTFNDHNASLTFFNWGEEMNTFEIGGYTNYPGSQFQWSEPLVFKAKEIAYYQCKFIGNEAHYTLTRLSDGYQITWVTPFKQSSRWLMRRVGTSIGGANNSEGEYGGKSTKDFYLHSRFRIL